MADPTETETETIEETETASPETNEEKEADALIDAMPNVQQHAVDAKAEEIKEVAAEFSEYKDKDGNGFDSSIHQMENGKPKISPRTGFLMKKRGAKKKSATSPEFISSDTQKSSPPVEIDKYVGMGKAGAAILQTLGTTLGGSDFVYGSLPGLDAAVERAGIEQALTDYARIKEIDDLPPGYVVAIALIGYAAPRMQMPTTKTRLEKLKLWYVEKMAARKARKDLEDQAEKKQKEIETK